MTEVDSITGDAIANCRKGKLIFFYELVCLAAALALHTFLCFFLAASPSAPATGAIRGLLPRRVRTRLLASCRSSSSRCRVWASRTVHICDADIWVPARGFRKVITLKWKGTTAGGEVANGTIKIPNLSEEQVRQYDRLAMYRP